MVSSTLRPHFTPRKDPVPILQGAGWAPGPFWTGGKSRPQRDSIPDSPARSQLLYRLSYRAHTHIYIYIYIYILQYIIMSRDQDAGRIDSMKIDSSSFERVEQFRYLGTTLTNQNSIQEQIKSRQKSGNACYHSVQSLLSSSLLSEN